MAVAGFVCQAVMFLWDPIKRHSGYLIHSHRYVENLNKKVRELIALRDDVKNSVQGAKRRGEDTKQEVKIWLEDVEKMANHRGEVTEDEVEEDVEKPEALQVTRSDEDTCNCLCLGWWGRYSLGKEADTKMGYVQALLDRRRMFAGSVSLPAPLPSFQDFHPTGDFQEFSSTQRSMRDILVALGDVNVWIVGVYGMGGVGKTTIVKAIPRQPETAGLFDAVVMCTVSQNPDALKIQNGIAGKLGFEFKNKDDKAVRAGELCQRIKQERRILVILDDLWNELDLATIGIPTGVDHTGCKVVITTREVRVCNQMGSKNNVRVDVLSDEDSWKLFKDNAFKTGDPGAAGEKLYKLGEQLVKECGHLPLAITILGRALTGENENEEFWQATLTKLRKSDPSNIPNVEEKVYNCLELSFRYLQSDDARLCFLFCCLFPEDTDIDTELLLRYAVGEEFLKDSGKKLNEAKGEVCVILRNLKNSCLLLEGEKKDSVRLHDVVRDVAIHIASSDTEYGFLAEAGTGSTQWPERANRNDYKRISLMSNQINESLKQFKSSKLLTLLLRENEDLRSVPDQFFQSMEQLLVLDLSGTGIRSLPPSLASLKNLRTLCLEHCRNLEDVSMVGELNDKLEILSLRGSHITMLPTEIGLLGNLRCLDLTKCLNLESVPPNVISKLTRLEQLHMEGSYDSWQVGGRGDGGQAAFSELFSLPLNVLSVWSGDPLCLSEGGEEVYFEGLTEFNMSIGVNYWQTEVRRSMCIGRFSGAQSFAKWVKLLLRRTVRLDLHFMPDINVLGLGISKELKYLELYDCNTEFLVGGPVKHDMLRDPFPCLERLKLSDNKSLTEICRGPPPPQFLNKLKILKVNSCDNLAPLLPSVLLSNARNLEDVRVDSCHGLQAVFQYEHNEIQEGLLCKLRTLEINYCRSLTTIFSWELVQGLHQLQELVISDCHQLKAVVGATSAEDEGAIQDQERTGSLLPKLKKLRLESLPSLVTFSTGNVHDTSFFQWPMLEELTVAHCTHLKKLPLNGSPCAPRLKEIKIYDADKGWLGSLEWEDDGARDMFLSKVYVWDWEGPVERDWEHEGRDRRRRRGGKKFLFPQGQGPTPKTLSRANP